jgi:hypothetical protein
MEVERIYAAKGAVEVGTWIPSPLFKGVEYLVRGYSNADARLLRDNLHEAIPRAERLKGLPRAKSAEIDAQVLSEAIWLDVRGLTKNKVAMDIAAAKALLLDPEIGDWMRADVTAASQNVGDDQLAGIEADAKN